MLGSNSADTAGNRIRLGPRTSSSPGTASGAPKRGGLRSRWDNRFCPMVSRANRFRSGRNRALAATRSLPTVARSICTVLVCQAAMRTARRGSARGEISFVFGTLSDGPAVRQHEDLAVCGWSKLLGQLRKKGDQTDRVCRLGRVTSRQRQISIFRRWFRGRRVRTSAKHGSSTEKPLSRVSERSLVDSSGVAIPIFGASIFRERRSRLTAGCALLAHRGLSRNAVNSGLDVYETSGTEVRKW